MTSLPTGMPDDAPSTTVTLTTSASPAQLWPLLTDPSTPAPFSKEFQGADWKDTEGIDPPALGARFIGHNRAGEFAWTTLSTVTAFEPQRRYGWTVQKLDDPVSDWTFELEPVDGGTELRYTCRLGPSELSGLNQAIARAPEQAEEFTARRLRSLERSMRSTLEGIAALAEGRDTSAYEYQG